MALLGRASAAGRAGLLASAAAVPVAQPDEGEASSLAGIAALGAAAARQGAFHLLALLDMARAAAMLAALAAARPGLCVIHTHERAQEAAAFGALSGAGWRLLGDESARYGRAGASRPGAQIWGV